MRTSEETNPLEDAIEWFLDYLVVERGASRNTVEAYYRDLRQAEEHFRKAGGKDWSDYQQSHLNAFHNSLANRGISARSLARKLSCLRSFFKFLTKMERGPQGLLRSDFTYRKPRSLPKALTLEEIEALMAVPDLNTPPGLRNRAMFELLYGTGLRISELMALVKENYIESESVLRIIGKRGKTRIVPIPAKSHAWFRKYIEEARPKLLERKSSKAKFREEPTIFLNQKGRPLSRSGVFRILQDCAAKARILKKISPHTLRHTYAVHLVQAGADLRSVQELLGHESVGTTEIYTHLDFATLKEKYFHAHPRSRNITK